MLQSKAANTSRTQTDALGRDTPYGTIFDFWKRRNQETTPLQLNICK